MGDAMIRFAATILIAAAAQAAQTNWPSVKAQPGKPVEQAEKAKAVTVERFRLKADKKEKDKPSKKETREFPLMFDILDKAAKHKAAKHKAKQAKQKGDK